MNPKFPPDAAPIKLFRHPLSGHSHRVELMLALLDVPYETVDLDLGAGAHKAEEYRKISPFGQVPAIDDNGVTLSDSNAILVYLTRTYSDSPDWLPLEPRHAAEVQRWLSVAAGDLASGPAVARLVTVFGAKRDWEGAKRKARDLFEVMENVLSARPFLAGDTVSIADISCYTYTAHAPEGGVSLEPFPSIRAWLARIEALPGFVPMAKTETGAVS